jgi:hypothetical protein
MADLLTHVLVPYILLTALGWVVDVPEQMIPVAMGGAAIPDLVKINIIVDADLVSGILGVPFSFSSISSLAGVVLISGVIALSFGDDCRRSAYGFLLFGGATALVFDGLRVFADGAAGFWLYPLWVRPPTPNLYVTSDPTVAVVAVITALVVGLLDRYLSSLVSVETRE